jgi:hypothetical protein
MATSFSGGRGRSTRREPPTMGKQLVSFITYSYESSAPFFVNYHIEICISVWQFDWNILEGIITPFFNQNVSSKSLESPGGSMS